MARNVCFAPLFAAHASVAAGHAYYSPECPLPLWRGKIKNGRNYTAVFVRLTGLEPARRETPDPKSGASTNSATGAKASAKVSAFVDYSNYLAGKYP
jgi:hypothetical protein